MLDSHLDTMQGRNEQRNETYLTYVKRAAEFLTQQSTKNASGVLGSAQKQASMVWSQQ